MGLGKGAGGGRRGGGARGIHVALAVCGTVDVRMTVTTRVNATLDLRSRMIRVKQLRLNTAGCTRIELSLRLQGNLSTRGGRVCGT